MIRRMSFIWTMAILLYLQRRCHGNTGSVTTTTTMDEFQKNLCHDRWSQMDWQSIIRPCRFQMQFGRKKHNAEKLRTSPKWSHTLGLELEKTGVFNKLAVKTRTSDGRNKIEGGDTWRIFIRGADMITPYVSDLNNGVYESKFIALQPGHYKAEIVLESTMCEAFKDPPQDWLKRDAATIINDEKDAKLLWEPLRGGNISFKIDASPKNVTTALRQDLKRWKESCGSQYQCDPLLWQGFGRWVNSTWRSYIDDGELNNDDDDEEEQGQECYKHNEGVLQMIGDEMTREISHYVRNKSLCNEIFQQCLPYVDAISEKKSLTPQKTFSTAVHLRHLKAITQRHEMDKTSGLLLTYGHPFVRNLSFKKYRMFIDRASKILKEKYKGRAVWRTMSTRWRDSDEAEQHFMNHQRIKLFNAYATSAMCNSGIPVLDVFQMTESAPAIHKEALINNIGKTLTNYFRRHPTKECIKKTNAKISSLMMNNGTATPTETEELSSKSTADEFPTLLQKNTTKM